MIRTAAVIALSLLASMANAQFGPTIGPGSVSTIGPSSGSGSGGGGGGTTPCAAGQLDWSDATGCNLTLYMIGLR